MTTDLHTTDLDSDRDPDQTAKIAVIPRASSAPSPRHRLALVVLSGGPPGTLFPVDGGEAVLGRGREASLHFGDTGLSRRHARVYRTGDAWWLEDLHSTNGTYVGGRPATLPVRLRDGDRIQAGGGVLLKVSFHDDREHEAAKSVYEAAVRDGLTRTHNRRFLEERLQAEWAFAVRHHTALSFLMVDVDHFKRINDTLGHLAGDAVLRVVGGTLQKMVRAEDLVARWGGEEFAVVARGIDPRNAIILGERIRRSLGNIAIPWEAQKIRITVSVGVATLCEGREYADAEALVGAADEALYAAKQAGRDRCIGAG